MPGRFAGRCVRHSITRKWQAGGGPARAISCRGGRWNGVNYSRQQSINKALAAPKVRESLAKLGAEPAGGTPAEYGDLVKSQIALWSKVVKDSGMKMQQ
jgi:tripartite-type tricarboxylate transporter receptor subunit TctC